MPRKSFSFQKKSENGRREGIRKQINYLYSMKIKRSLGNEAEEGTGVHQGKLTTDNFDFRRVLPNLFMSFYRTVLTRAFK